MGREYQRTCKYCGGETNKEICRLCASHGKPTTKQEVLARFPQIRDIKIVASSRGHVTSISRIGTLCVDCKQECSVEYKTFLEHPNEVRCQSCSARHGRKQVLVYPKDVLDIEVVNQETLGGIGQFVERTWIRFICINCGKSAETRYGAYRKGLRRCAACALSRNRIDVFPETVKLISEWKAETLGKRGQLVSGTEVTVSCNKCKSRFNTRWHYVRVNTENKKDIICFNCGTRVGVTPEGKVNGIAKIREQWANPELKKKMLSGRMTGNYSKTLSGLHRRVKRFLIDNGYKDFQSEKWIGRGVRVDEVDFDRRIVLEVMGDYFHANPEKYKPSDVLSLGARGKITARAIWRHDRNRKKKIESWGWKVVEIWESKFNQDHDSVLRLLNGTENTVPVV